MKALCSNCNIISTISVSVRCDWRPKPEPDFPPFSGNHWYDIAAQHKWYANTMSLSADYWNREWSCPVCANSHRFYSDVKL